MREFTTYVAMTDYAGKVDLSKGYWNPKRKLGVTTHFSEIIKQQVPKKSQNIKQCVAFFPKLKLNYLMVTPNFLLGYQEHLLSSAFFSFKPRKNIPVLVGATNRKPECLEMRRTCAQ